MAAGAKPPRPLGRLEPADWEHVERYPLSAVLPATVDHVERTLRAPGWLVSHDQGQEGSCVGHAVALERAITNRAQAVAGVPSDTRTVRYDPIDLWNAAKAVDEWPSTKPGDTNGTSVRAAYNVAAARGLSPVSTMRLVDGKPRAFGAREPDPNSGVATYRWASNVDEVRTAIANGLPVAIGVSWFAAFDNVAVRKGERWLPGPESVAGRPRGGHAVCLSGASDRRQAFRLLNSWGRSYPPAWLPYATLEALLGRAGEAAVVTDR